MGFQSTGAQAPPVNPRSFHETYVAGTTVVDGMFLLNMLDPTDFPGGCTTTTPKVCAIAGVLICSPVTYSSQGSGGQLAHASIGGACGWQQPMVVGTGDTVFTSVVDRVMSGNPFTVVCVDGNANGVCRPEEIPTDTLALSCGFPSSFTHTGPPGPMAVFIMTGATPCASTPTAGDIYVEIQPAGSECTDGIDNDANGNVDADDLSCAITGTEFDLPQCSDGLDNDGDTNTDNGADTFCTGWDDNSEDSIAEDGACSDGLDGDDDGWTDFPRDPGCLSLWDDSEQDHCVSPLSAGFGGNNPFVPACADELVPTCMDGMDNDANAGGGYWYGSDFVSDAGCAFNPLAAEGFVPECGDGIDNDGDGLADFLGDLECATAWDPLEFDACELNLFGCRSVLPPCSDLVDNDGDGMTDAGDAGCASFPLGFFSGVPDRESPQPVYQCSDGLDNDFDGSTDGSDPQCTVFADNSESYNPTPRCSNGIDDDGDGLVDGNDPDCLDGPSTDSESPNVPAKAH